MVFNSSFCSYPLVGEAISPTPKGPYNITPNSPVTIHFWNPFMTDEHFLFNITAPFNLKRHSEEIKSRKETKIVVSMPHLDQKGTTTGKLLVTCERNTKTTQWTYYFHNNMSWIKLIYTFLQFFLGKFKFEYVDSSRALKKVAPAPKSNKRPNVNQIDCQHSVCEFALFITVLIKVSQIKNDKILGHEGMWLIS